MKLSVWLMPAASDATRLSELIARCAHEFGAPTFPPHITLCSEPTETTASRGDLALELPLSLTFASVDYGTDYFHACYLKLRDDASVLALQARCAAALHGRVNEQYPPHLSLAYGGLTPQQRDQVPLLVPSLPLLARFDRLETWNTTGPVSNWQPL
jgi:hypothetical protein